MSTDAQQAHRKTVTSKIPQRMDRLPWSRFHWLVLLGLGVTWILDGLEVTIKGAVGPALQDPSALGLSSGQVGLSATIYLLGAVSGALLFGFLTDRMGRKKLFFWTLGLYMVANLATAASVSFAMFAVFRFLVGMGIGGEYAAIYSAIDELIPARSRGWADLVISGSYWIGTAVGASVMFVVLDAFPASWSWRLGFAIGPVLAVGILVVRRFVPESPRWLLVHGRDEEAEEKVASIEQRVRDDGHELPEPEGSIEVEERGSIGILPVIKLMFTRLRRRSIVGLALMAGQAFLYNAIFFTFGLVLSNFFGVDKGMVPLFLLPFAVGNFLGPLVLGRFFDTVGRRPMIAGTYTISAVLLGVTGWLFAQGVLTAVTITVAWTVIFFFASAAASAAYLTVSEVFPLEMRALAIAVFYAIGTGIGGALSPWLFGSLIGTGNRMLVFYGYLLGVVVMLVGAGVEWFMGIEAAQESLEDVARPLAAVDRDEEAA